MISFCVLLNSEWEKITSSTAPKDWTEGKRAEFTLGEFDNSVWDTNELYIDCQCKIILKQQKLGVDPFVGNRTVNNIDGQCTVALEQHFTSGLVELVDVSVGGLSTKNMEAPANLYPHLQGLYILVNDTQHPASKGGNAVYDYLVGNLDNPTVPGVLVQLRRAPSSNMSVDVYNDTLNPFEMSIDKRKSNILPINSIIPVPFDLQANETAANPAFNYHVYKRDKFTSGYVYRNALTKTEYHKELDTIADPTGQPDDYFIRFVMKIKDGYLNNPYKKPANMKHKIALTRCRDVQYALNGDSKSDAILSNFITLAGTDNEVTYDIIFDTMDMYCKRLILSEAQLSIYRSIPLLEYDVQRWSAQSFILQSKSFNQLVNFPQTPQALFVCVRESKFINIPPVGSVGNPSFDKIDSIHCSPLKANMRISELYINTIYGQIPSERYRLNDASVNPDKENVRAYEDFIRACKGYPNDVIDYQTWSSNYTWFGFVLNSSQANPFTEVTLPSRANVNISLQVVGTQAETDFSILVVALYHGKLGIANLKSAFMSV